MILAGGKRSQKLKKDATLSQIKVQAFPVKITWRKTLSWI